MTTMKKLVSLILAVMMLLSVCAVANADEATKTYTITITGDKGHTYEAYQIFTGDLAGDVLSNIVLGDGVKNGILTYGGTTYADAAALAKVLTTDNVADFMDHVSKNLAAVAGTSTETNGTYTISGLEPGYYFIKDKDESVPAGDAYTKFIAKIVKDTTATPKTDKTTHEKKVYENVKPATNPKSGEAGNNYNDVADYSIGDTVPFALYSKVPDLTNYTHYEMTFHDKMSAGLTLDATSITVSVGGTKLVLGTDYTVTNTGCTDGCSFEVKILELVGKNYGKGAEIRVDFNATLNSSAVIGLDGNTNESMLEFSNNPNDTTDTTTTPNDKVIVFTYELDVTKVDATDTTKKLQGAEFVLQNKAGSYVTVDGTGKVTGWVASMDNASVLTSGADGLFKVIGLDDGEYTLTETKAPEGYNLLANPITLVITATTKNDQNWTTGEAKDALTALEITVDGTKAEGVVDTGVVSTTVNNNVGATLPETGGIGTTIFYAVGGLLVVMAVVLLITKRRVGEEN